MQLNRASLPPLSDDAAEQLYAWICTLETLFFECYEEQLLRQYSSSKLPQQPQSEAEFDDDIPF